MQSSTTIGQPLSHYLFTTQQRRHNLFSKLKPSSFSRLPQSLARKLFSGKSWKNPMGGVPSGTNSVFDLEDGDGGRTARSSTCAHWVDTVMNRLSKWLIAALFSAVVLLRRDAEALWFAMGSVCNVVLSTTLKQLLNQERPASALSSGPGMPSSHAQSIFFAAVFVILSMAEWLSWNAVTVILSGLVLAIGSYLSWLRVSLNYHTISQVIVGAIVGSIFCILWFWMWNAFVLRAFMSHLWVRVGVVLGAGCFCFGFVIHVIRYWIKKEH